MGLGLVPAVEGAQLLHRLGHVRHGGEAEFGVSVCGGIPEGKAAHPILILLQIIGPEDVIPVVVQRIIYHGDGPAGVAAALHMEHHTGQVGEPARPDAVRGGLAVFQGGVGKAFCHGDIVPRKFLLDKLQYFPAGVWPPMITTPGEQQAPRQQTGQAENHVVLTHENHSLQSWGTVDEAPAVPHMDRLHTGRLLCTQFSMRQGRAQ